MNELIKTSPKCQYTPDICNDYYDTCNNHWNSEALASFSIIFSIFSKKKFVYPNFVNISLGGGGVIFLGGTAFLDAVVLSGGVPFSMQSFFF